MNDLPKKRWWLRISIRRILVFTLAIAVVLRFLVFVPVTYHDAVTWNRVTQAHSIDEPRLFSRIPHRIWYGLDFRSQKIVWRHEDQRFMSHWLVIDTRDSDLDGFFDQERHLYFAPEDYLHQKILREWTKTIHIPVPKRIGSQATAYPAPAVPVPGLVSDGPE